MGNKQGFAALPKKRVRELAKIAGKVKHPNKGFGSLTAEERKALGSKAAKARWAKAKEAE